MAPCPGVEIELPSTTSPALLWIRTVVNLLLNRHRRHDPVAVIVKGGSSTRMVACA